MHRGSANDVYLGDEKTIDRKVYLNTKLSVQVVAPKLQERRLYHAMAHIDNVLQNGAVGRPKL
jgi:amidase